MQLATLKIGDPTKTISGTRTEHPVVMNRMRKRIAERLKEAQNTTAMLTTFNECDMRYPTNFRCETIRYYLYFLATVPCSLPASVIQAK